MILIVRKGRVVQAINSPAAFMVELCRFLRDPRLTGPNPTEGKLLLLHDSNVKVAVQHEPRALSAQSPDVKTHPAFGGRGGQVPAAARPVSEVSALDSQTHRMIVVHQDSSVTIGESVFVWDGRQLLEFGKPTEWSAKNPVGVFD